MASSNPVLPGTQRFFPFMVPARLEDGEYKLTVRIDYGAEEPLFLEHLFSVKEGEIREEA
ncbi:MAG: hypothetical protein GX766_10670 [Firmicutes bacterium]|nr:hypothetical protein [Bacillota bacterium]HOB22709.1 hypothetical protein [Bacillota bacterium]